jgi:predicted metal-dependent phosphoesterase TrpH
MYNPTMTGEKMVRIDLHLHSKYSEHPSEWFLQRIGAKESYTDPEEIYALAKQRGMDFVTITDHNRIEGALYLRERYPDETILGVETTTYFPEDGCKVHILLYGFDEDQFKMIQKIRTNIYDLREYIKTNNLAYSVAHLTYSVNKRLTREHVEKLILLFDVFEGINGGRNFHSNQEIMDILENLTPKHIFRLQHKHQLEPMSAAAWKKSFTAGSDDHSGLFVGKTYTLMDAANTQGVLHCIRSHRTMPMGRHNDYKSLAFTVYKIAYDFSRAKQPGAPTSLPGQFTENLFTSSSLGVKNKLKIQAFRALKKNDEHRVSSLFLDLIQEVQKINPLEVDERLGLIYEKTSEIADEFFKYILRALEKDIDAGDVVNAIRNISSSIPGLFLSLPFFSALKHTYQSRKLVGQIRRELEMPGEDLHQKMLWFTDSLDDLDILSETQEEWASQNGNKVRLVKSVPLDTQHKSLPPNVIFLPAIFSTHLLGHAGIPICFPSVLKALSVIHDEDPTAIYISTPGPLGLFGVLCARLLNIPATGIYHTEFVSRFERISDDQGLTELIETYVRWFYSLMDTIKVTARGHVDILESRGIEKSKIQISLGA